MHIMQGMHYYLLKAQLYHNSYVNCRLLLVLQAAYHRRRHMAAAAFTLRVPEKAIITLQNTKVKHHCCWKPTQYIAGRAVYHRRPSMAPTAFAL